MPIEVPMTLVCERCKNRVQVTGLLRGKAIDKARIQVPTHLPSGWVVTHDESDILSSRRDKIISYCPDHVNVPRY